MSVDERKHWDVSEEKISLELLGMRVATLTAEVRDLQLRFGALERRFGAMETRLGALDQRFGAQEERFGAQEERMTRMLALLVRVAERVGVSSPG